MFVTLLAACGGGDEPLATAGPSSMSATSQPGDDPSMPTEGSGDTGDQPGCGGPSPVIVPREPSPECDPDVPCASDDNCPVGHACNTALEPPGCTLLYCGATGTPCHDDTVCEEGLRCHAGLCNPCTFCGDLCEVDFSSDPEHCGCCDHPVPAGRVCVDGAFDCLAGATKCGDSCVDLASDPLHCGGCDQPVDPGFVCVDGQPGCAAPQLLCDGKCVTPSSDDDNCGACGATCPAGRCAGLGICLLEVGDPAVIPLSCDAMCEAAGMTCWSAGSVVGTAYYVGPCDQLQTPIVTCDAVPAEKDSDSDSQCGFGCTCGLAGQACSCDAKAP